MPRPTPPPDAAPEDPPVVHREQLARVLEAAATDAAVIGDRQGQAIGWGLQVVSVVAPRGRLWELLLWWEADGRLGSLAGAVAPDGGRWSPGCDRWPGWEAGADSVPLEPLRHLLSQEQRERLRARLWACVCWPAPEQPIRPPPPTMAELFPLNGDWWEALPS